MFSFAPSEPHVAEFPSYYKPAYMWDPVPSSYELRQMSFSPTVLQHTSSLYGTHVSRSPQQQQPLDCSTHYSPTSNTYHCITCDKVHTHTDTAMTSCRQIREIVVDILHLCSSSRCSPRLMVSRSTSGGPIVGHDLSAAAYAGRRSATLSVWSST